MARTRRRGFTALITLLTAAGCTAAPPRPAIPIELRAPHHGDPSPPLPTLEAAKPTRLTPMPAPAPEPRSAAELIAEHEARVARGDAPPVRAPAHPAVPRANFGICLRGAMCRLEGMCTPGADGQCMAATRDDCAGSDACMGGRCSARNGVCIAASDEDCRGSWACKGWGRCFHDGEGTCAAGSVADCRASTRCIRLGECTLLEGACVKPAKPGPPPKP